MNILLVEPDFVLAKTYSKVLDSQDYSVVTKSSAQSAVDVLNSLTFDLIILEIQMANHNGLEFLNELRSYSEWQELPIIILTMVPRESLAVQDKTLEQLGIKDYLYKPVTSSSNLLSSVNQVLPKQVWTK